MILHFTPRVAGAICAAAALGALAWRTPAHRPRTFLSLAFLAAGALAAAYGLAFDLHAPEHIVRGTKAAIALSAAALSMIEGARRLAGQRTPRRVVQALAMAVAAWGTAAYVSFGDIGYARFYHRHEFFHYYLGAKYDRELGYEWLYKCTAVAQVELGQGNEVRARKLRELVHDQLEPTAPTLEHPELCKQRFADDRWAAFKADVKFFRSTSSLQYWNDMQKDHGYNPPPVWTLTGHLLASIAPASDTTLLALSMLDPLLFVATFAVIGWGFGWRVFAVALGFWGCQVPAEYFWTGGAFLRQDWLFFIVASACLLRKRWFALAGAALAWATLLRVFPGIVLIGWLVVALAYFARHKRWKREHLRVAMGGIVATALLVPVSAAVAGPQAYIDFKHHIDTHMATPLTNNMGLRTLVSHGPAGRMKFTRDEKQLDPFGDWKRMRRERFEGLKPLYLLTLGALGVAYVWVVRRVRSLWIAQALAVVFVAATVEMTCYYYSIFLLAILLSRVRKGFEQGALFVAGMSQLLVQNRLLSYYYDDRYTVQSLLFLGWGVVMLCAFATGRRKPKLAPATPPGEAPAVGAS